MSLQIGSVTVPENVVLAPMSGVTDLPFRQQVRRFGEHLVVSEMIASDAMTRIQQHQKEVRKMHGDCAAESPLSVQLAGTDPQEMAEAAKMNEARGAMIIDINMGCPAKKVTKGYAGSALMRQEKLAADIMEATVNAVKVPVTLKMRLGWDDDDRNAPRLARIAEDLGIQMLTIHGRTRCQFYKGEADWDAIADVKNAVSIPVIGNGDVVSEEDAAELLRRSGADGVMVGRGVQGRPWFLNQVSHYLKTGTKLPSPGLEQQLETILAHYDAILDHHGLIPGYRIARKHLGWYCNGLRDATEFRRTVNVLDDPVQVKDAIRAFYEPKIETELRECAA
ncbi:tRNA dihydrouridine synthase DusB [Thalassospira marina]|uniref:tRNA-dihydrouridine synthase n=1 Tax=Thalassospira marina TaxID=2048283 RepID=A0A2N3KJJ4_9PROT|nr:tRNA dihydrouridine synthase DusB [Thalassospira marina]AUG52943.1 tRNA dihydrouridine synthase DusB [Thalassospira marina]PKR50715.1 tRNA dihydrouridine synthase DusB [Thalassospira marina]